ncbi:hypothetical protein VaNZ11_002327, partial [Volvox africanus]
RYASHPGSPTGFKNVGMTPRWISTSPVAFAPIGQQFVVTLWQNATFHRAFQVSAEQLQAATAAASAQGGTSVAALTSVADDVATVFLNDRPLGQAAPLPSQSMFPTPTELLRADHNLIVVCASSAGGPSVVVVPLIAANGSVLVHTDAFWNWF